MKVLITGGSGFIGSHLADRLSLEDLPPWAPTLNPVDTLWGWLKYDQLCNFAPRDALQLDDLWASGQAPWKLWN